MPLTICENGEVREMTPEEEAAYLASLPPPETPTVGKATVQDRLDAKGKLRQAMEELLAEPERLARWFAPGRDRVDCAHPDTVAFVEDLGEDPAEILAPD